jgi:hypothetical protein
MDDRFAKDAEIADLSRRLRALEALLAAGHHDLMSPRHLVALYWDAAEAPELNEINARNWERLIYFLDARSLLSMARGCGDPMPWHPFMLLVDLFITEGFDLSECRAHLLSAAQDLLNLQGLRKLRPTDLSHTPLRIRTALAAIRR